jgi:hypothetical protein
MLQTQDLWPVTVLAVFLLAGLWHVVRNINTFKATQYRFYLTSALFQGGPFFLGAIVYFFFPENGYTLIIIAFIANQVGRIWLINQEKQEQEKNAEAWHAWLVRRTKMNVWRRLMFE